MARTLEEHGVGVEKPRSFGPTGSVRLADLRIDQHPAMRRDSRGRRSREGREESLDGRARAGRSWLGLHPQARTEQEAEGGHREPARWSKHW